MSWLTVLFMSPREAATYLRHHIDWERLRRPEGQRCVAALTYFFASQLLCSYGQSHYLPPIFWGRTLPWSQIRQIVALGVLPAFFYFPTSLWKRFQTPPAPRLEPLSLELQPLRYGAASLFLQVQKEDPNHPNPGLLSQLPGDVLQLIIWRLDRQGLATFNVLCRSLHHFSDANNFWDLYGFIPHGQSFEGSNLTTRSLSGTVKSYAKTPYQETTERAPTTQPLPKIDHTSPDLSRFPSDLFQAKKISVSQELSYTSSDNDRSDCSVVGFETGEVVAHYLGGHFHFKMGKRVTSCALLGRLSGCHLLIGTEGGQTSIWRFGQNDPHWILKRAGSAITALAIAQSKKRCFLLTGNETGAICLWDLSSGAYLAQLKSLKQKIWSLGASLDEKSDFLMVKVQYGKSKEQSIFVDLHFKPSSGISVYADSFTQ